VFNDERVGPCGFGRYTVSKVIADVLHTLSPVLAWVELCLDTIELGLAKNAGGFRRGGGAREMREQHVSYPVLFLSGLESVPAELAWELVVKGRQRPHRQILVQA
jgi:hypothetical protein